jgi:hypothetical protein
LTPLFHFAKANRCLSNTEPIAPPIAPPITPPIAPLFALTNNQRVEATMEATRPIPQLLSITRSTTPTPDADANATRRRQTPTPDADASAARRRRLVAWPTDADNTTSCCCCGRHRRLHDGGKRSFKERQSTPTASPTFVTGDNRSLQPCCLGRHPSAYGCRRHDDINQTTIHTLSLGRGGGNERTADARCRGRRSLPWPSSVATIHTLSLGHGRQQRTHGRRSFAVAVAVARHSVIVQYFNALKRFV